MGWNGANTYGVRVDSARISDTTNNITWANVSGKPDFTAGRAYPRRADG